MSRFKKRYCAASVLFAIAVVLLTVFTGTSDRSTVYAADSDTIFDMPEPDDITGFADQDNPVSDAQAEATDNSTNGFSITYNNESGSVSTPIRMLLVLTVLSLAPSLLVMMTSFTRIIIVLHFVRTAIGTQTAPPNQVLIGLALFLTFFIMWPTFQEINTNAIQPLDQGLITQQEAIKAAEEPIREFMYGQTRTKDMDVFIEISGETYESYEDIPFTTLVPAFILSELRSAFIMGFLIYIPFIVIDMVVSSVLMSMGMMMLPPTTISLPFKILLFILADGWDLVIGSLVKTFY
jgi:flagellar biosynthetic protein FliP